MEIALIGAGPRNLMALERVISWAAKNQWQEHLLIHIFDPFGIAGRVWNPNQNHEFKMNSLAAKITLYTDSSVEINGPIEGGPTLLQWAQQFGIQFINSESFKRSNLLIQEIEQMNQGSYASRALFGVYQQWFYQKQLLRLPSNITVQLHEELITNVQRTEEQHFIVISESAAYDVNAISAALGEGTNQPTSEQRQLSEYAQDNDLTYVPIAYPSEVDLDDIEPRDHVIIRGLGLSFIDYLSELTERRGGQFIRNENGDLSYKRSGDEPTIYASSRKGLPYHARGRDEKLVGELYPKHFLTDRFVNQMIADKTQISGDQFLQLVFSEVEYTYYIRLMEPRLSDDQLIAFKQELRASSKDFKPILDKYSISNDERLDWKILANPLPNVKDTLAFTDFLKKYLQQDIDMAKAGNKTNPFTSAMEKLRELRSNIRKVVSFNLISNDDYIRIFLNYFNALNSFLAVGPPIFRIEQILALIKSSVLTLIGPDMIIETENGHFTTYSKRLNDVRYEANVLIEGRLPSPNASHTRNKLVKNIVSSGLGRPYSLILANGEQYTTGALDVTVDTAELIDKQGIPVSNFFVWGLSTEQRHWLTNGAPIPGVNDVRLRMADKIAELIDGIIE
ncbi:FAD/NAD(P)-binding protein [Pediococcus argentinicus]|uniref:FAD(NAD)-dependent oxidoreductase n=1 Tax=Pediococcus argentinicus TaxID=480391 RepID=A0A0R2NGJ8_9LACO|nr:FAD/NAD(P)-binding protein [Pediococcus argentinicus]KRO24937.1 FAD(NAD)-dependent oxidoreductase [Pediococcus argentinicus]NKZ22624.1 FAD/NAD(P)-binding protein [Pediococcus argentinicus]GEP19665.1 FAD-dependent oxidoreductase [Pediococcus argentinicus]